VTFTAVPMVQTVPVTGEVIVGTKTSRTLRAVGMVRPFTEVAVKAARAVARMVVNCMMIVKVGEFESENMK